MTSMSYDGRVNFIGTLLREHILPRYKRPEHLGEESARSELRDMVEDLNAEWPLMSEAVMEETAQRMFRELRASHTSRSWPTIGAMTKALKAALSQPQATAATGEPPQLYEWIREWWLRHRDCPRHLKPQEHHSRRLVDERVVTWGELWRRGFPVPRELVRVAKEEPDPKHQGIMEDLQAMGRRIRGEEIEPLDKRFAGDWKQAKPQVQP